MEKFDFDDLRNKIDLLPPGQATTFEIKNPLHFSRIDHEESSLIFHDIIRACLDADAVPQLLPPQKLDQIPEEFLGRVEELAQRFLTHKEFVKINLGLDVLKIAAHKLNPVDDSDYPGVAFLVCASGDPTKFKLNAGASPALADPRNESFVVWNQEFPKVVFDIARKESKKDLLVYIHQDLYLPKNWGPRFWRAYQEAEKKFGKIGVAGVFGVSGNRNSNSRIHAGNIVDQLGLRVLTGELPLPSTILTLDEVVLAVKRDGSIDPDPDLKWHFYAADMCLKAHESWEEVVALDSFMFHCSFWHEPPQAFLDSLQVFKQKWSRVVPMEVPCMLVE